MIASKCIQYSRVTIDAPCRTVCFVTGQLTQMDNVKMQRLRALDQRLRHNGALVKAHEWIKQQSQQGRFRGLVYGPILIEVQCSDVQHIKYLEQACSSELCCLSVLVCNREHACLVLQIVCNHNT